MEVDLASKRREDKAFRAYFNECGDDSSKCRQTHHSLQSLYGHHADHLGHFSTFVVGKCTVDNHLLSDFSGTMPQ